MNTKKIEIFNLKNFFNGNIIEKDPFFYDLNSDDDLVYLFKTILDRLDFLMDICIKDETDIFIAVETLKYYSKVFTFIGTITGEGKTDMNDYNADYNQLIEMFNKHINIIDKNKGSNFVYVEASLVFCLAMIPYFLGNMIKRHYWRFDKIPPKVIEMLECINNLSVNSWCVF